MSKQVKKIKNRKISKQMSMSIVMVIVSVVILSISTYAWFLITNTPKAENITLMADTLGDLKIADIDDEGNPLEYGDEIDLTNTTDVKSYLSPVTTKDGISFFSPIYFEGKVTDLKEETDENRLHTKYVYEKEFYLRAGEAKENVDADKAKNYDIFLVGTSTDTTNGCYMVQNSMDTTGNVITAANSLRVSLTFENVIIDGVASDEKITVIYEPNCDKENEGEDGVNRAYFSYAGTDTESDKFGTYTTIQQYYDRSFVPNSNIQSRSEALCTIKEGEDVKVTMRIWLEGMDEDCVNEIAADEILGQIQFISEENLEQFEEETTEEETTASN